MRLALSEIPTTEDTHAACLAAGIMDVPNSELAAQAALALHVDADGEPECYGRRFDPQQRKCLGCIYYPSCYTKDDGYLRRLRAGRALEPPGVPKSALMAALDKVSRRRAVPPPPRKKNGK